jgi:hypothetical protein
VTNFLGVYSEYTRLNSRSEHSLSWLKLFVVCLNIFRYILG